MQLQRKLDNYQKQFKKVETDRKNHPGLTEQSEVESDQEWPATNALAVSAVV